MGQMKKRADLIYEYETKIAKAKRNNDTEAQYYYQDKLDELLREDDLELIKLVPFGINVTLKFSHGVDAENYEEAVEIVKSSFLEEYGINLQDNEIDQEEFDLRSVLDLLDANGYEDASNFLQLHFAEEEEE